MYTSKVNRAEIKVCTGKKRKDRSGSTVSSRTPNSVVHRCFFRRRRMTISGYGDIKRYSASKQHNIMNRRRINSIALPTKFLLGGNITDPLNLKSLENEDQNHLTVFTPPSSPVPISKHRTQVKVLIPPNIYDPLNLTTGEEILFKVITSKPRKRKRRRKNFIEDGDTDSTNVSHTDLNSCQTDSSELKQPPDILIANDTKNVSVNVKDKKTFHFSQWTESKPNNDKIVSPVVPQGNRRFFKRLNSKCVIRVGEVSKSKNKKRQKRYRRKTKKTEVVFKKCADFLCYGSHIRDPEVQDARFKYFTKNTFCEKNVLDVGCNVGHVSIYIAKHLEAKHVTAVDISQYVIDVARKHLFKHWENACFKDENFPISMGLSYGSISRLPILDAQSSTFPHNVTFIQGNYVLNSDDDLELLQHEYDVILCLRVSKWIHLNWGDDGLKRSFKRMFTQLRYGGQLIFEPQPWASYAKAKKLSATVFNNYNNIQLKPENFIDYLMSDDVGFTTCTVMARAIRASKGIKQPLYLLTKGFAPSEDVQQPVRISPVVYNDAEWANRVDEQDSCDWDYSVISGDNSSDCALQTPSESSHFEAYSTNHAFLDDYNIFPTYEEADDTFE